MAQEFVLQPPPPLEPAPQPTEVTKTLSDKKKLYLFLGGGFLLTLIIGIFIGRLFSSRPQPVAAVPTQVPTATIAVSPTSTPTPTPISELPSGTISFLPSKQYFDDTYVIVEKDSPHRAVILSVARIEQERNYVQFIKVHHYTGKEWLRKSVSTTINTSSVKTNPLLRQWNETNMVTSSKNRIPLAEIQLDEITLQIKSSDLKNEISIQSQPGSTKFIYQGKGLIAINGGESEAYVYYARSYSFNALDLSYLANPALVNSRWMVFWDTEGSFYNLDSLSLKSSRTSSQQRNIAIREDNTRSVLKALTPSANIYNSKNSKEYRVSIREPFRETIKIPLQNVLTKENTRNLSWFTSISEGTVVKQEGRTVQGVGVIEDITSR